MRPFLLRGLDKVRSSWRFDCAAHNLIRRFRVGAGGRPERVFNGEWVSRIGGEARAQTK
ncbi:MAG: hypothetical protein ACPLPT_02830 [Moorellales bacterium]